MRRIIPVLVGLSLSAVPAEARPLADPAPWVLPVNVFAKAKPGDWTLLEGDAVINGKTVHEREVVRVGAVAGGTAEVQLFEGPAAQPSWFLSFPVDTKRGPDTNLLYDLPWIATDLHTAKATCKLGAESIPCMVVDYKTASHTVTAFLSPRVRGSGLVSFEIREGDHAVWTMTTIGYGTAGKAEWGAGPPPADLQANWDGGAKPTADRDGSAPATKDEYELPPLGTAPRADLTRCETLGTTDNTAVVRYVLRRLRSIEDCYLAAVAAKPKLGGGAVDLHFSLDETSIAGELLAEGSAAPEVRACVTKTLDAAQFPPPDGGGLAEVECTFAFDPGKPAPPRPKGYKPKLIAKGHPARGGPDLRGVQRIP